MPLISAAGLEGFFGCAASDAPQPKYTVDGREVMSSKPLRQGSFVMLWAGENPAVHADLLEELQAAGIPFADKSLGDDEVAPTADPDRKSTRLNSSHSQISDDVFCLPT